jgi:benzoyl-CoA-dihydrodiol lyase
MIMPYTGQVSLATHPDPATSTVDAPAFPPVDFQTAPARYRHWRLQVDGALARLTMAVQPDGGLRPGYALKLNSYDLGVDIELADAIQRLRFEHPQVRCLVLDGALEKVFCAGANIQMLRTSGHAWKVNFCKFTNETRLTLEDYADNSGVRTLAACNGATAGGGYELALACERILLVDDRNSAVSLPEVPLLAVLPGTGGLTRVVDKRRVRRDLADVFCTLVEGIKGRKAVEWRLVDDLAPLSRFAEERDRIARELAASVPDRSDRRGVPLGELEVAVAPGARSTRYTALGWDPQTRIARLTLRLPAQPGPADAAAARSEGARWWFFELMRGFDDALLHLRVNLPEINLVTIRVEGDPAVALAADALLAAHQDDWFVHETTLYARRVLKRLDLTAKSLFAHADAGTAFAGTFLEVALACDRIYLLSDETEAVQLGVSSLNGGAYPMGNGLTRLETRFLDDDAAVAAVLARHGVLDVEAAEALSLATEALDRMDWDDQVRVQEEERAAYSPDALTGMEANLRFPGPETMETKIFGRLTAWQNWIFQRPNAVGGTGALQCYGTPNRPQFDYQRT